MGGEGVAVTGSAGTTGASSFSRHARFCSTICSGAFAWRNFGFAPMRRCSASIDSRHRRRTGRRRRCRGRSTRRAARSAIRDDPEAADPDHERGSSASIGIMPRRTLRRAVQSHLRRRSVYTCVPSLPLRRPAAAARGCSRLAAAGSCWTRYQRIDEVRLVLKRVVMRHGNAIDPSLQQRITLEHGDLGTKELGGAQNDGVTVAVSGKLDYAGEPRFAIGLACIPMPGAARSSGATLASRYSCPAEGAQTSGRRPCRQR